MCRTYLVLGVEHILFGVDHLLFVLALLILVKGWRKLVGTITAFTVAHSITLAAATLGFVHVPQAGRGDDCLKHRLCGLRDRSSSPGTIGLTERWPWIVALTFGLLHGLALQAHKAKSGCPRVTCRWRCFSSASGLRLASSSSLAPLWP